MVLSGHNMKLANVVKIHEIGGKPYYFGKLTVGMGIEIESYLKTLPTAVEQIERSGILKSASKEAADSIVQQALQDLDLYPPDAITALYSRRFLMSSQFGGVLVRAALRQYNPGLTTQDIEDVANQATHEDVLKIQNIAGGIDENAPKGVADSSPQA